MSDAIFNRLESILHLPVLEQIEARKELSDEEREALSTLSSIRILEGHIKFYEKQPTKYWQEAGKQYCEMRIARKKALLRSQLQDLNH